MAEDFKANYKLLSIITQGGSTAGGHDRSDLNTRALA